MYPKGDAEEKACAVANGVAGRPDQSARLVKEQEVVHWSSARRSGRIWSTCGSLHLAATTMQCEVEAALEALLEAGEVPEYESVKARVVPGEALACPEVHVTMPDLGVYDALLEGEGVVA